MVVGNAYDVFFMAVGNAYDFSWWLATRMIFHGGRQRLWLVTHMTSHGFMAVGNAYDFSRWLATPMLFHGGWQRL